MLGRGRWLGVVVRPCQRQVAPDRRERNRESPERQISAPDPASCDPARTASLTYDTCVPTQPGEYKLGDWLADADTIAMLTSGRVHSLTYKANQFGPNIT